MRILNLVLMAVFLLVNPLFEFILAQGKVHKLANDHYEIIFDDEAQDSISILQVTDLHLGNIGCWKKDFTCVRRIKKLVKMYQPDMIAITGDLFTGNKDGREASVVFAAQFFDDLGVPWVYVHGNHDPEGGTGRETIRRIFADSEWGLLGFHYAEHGSVKHDYQVDLKLINAKRPAWEIYAFDSGSEPGNKSIKADQLLWYQKKSQASKQLHGQMIPAISIFHIPLKQYEMLWLDDSLEKKGFFHEKVCYEEDDGRVYEAFLKQGNIKACFCGHDHDNNYWGKYHGGILLVYGHVSGDTGYHRYWPPGAKFIKLAVDGGQISIKDVVLLNDI